MNAKRVGVQQPRAVALAVVVLAVVAVVRLLYLATRGSLVERGRNRQFGAWSGSALGPDTTTDALVKGHDFIVIGTITGYLGSELVPSGTELATSLPPDMPTEMWEDFQDSMSSFGVAVEKVLLDRDGEFGALGVPLVVDDPWGPPYPTDTSGCDGYIRVGDRYLMVLSKRVDADRYVMWNMVADRIVVDGPTPVDSKCAAVPSAVGMTTEAFLLAVSESIAAQYPTPTP